MEDHINLELALNGKSEKHPEAIEAYDLAIRNVPTVLAYYNKGVSLSLLEDYRKAIISYDKALEINSYFVPALNNKGLCFHYLKEYTQAISCYEKAYLLEPFYIHPLNNIGISLFELKRYKEAIRVFEKVIELDTSFMYALICKTICLIALSRNEEAAIFFEKSSKHYSKSNFKFANKATSTMFKKYLDAIILKNYIELEPTLAQALTD